MHKNLHHRWDSNLTDQSLPEVYPKSQDEPIPASETTVQPQKGACTRFVPSGERSSMLLFRKKASLRKNASFVNFSSQMWDNL